MSAPVTAFVSSHDLKKRNAHSGGFSDGGVVCFSKPLSSSPVELAPAPGTSLVPFNNDVGNEGAAVGANASVLILNFDPNVPVDVQVSMVHEDGSTTLIGQATVPANSPDGSGATPVPPVAGILLSHPNKLRYKLVASSGYELPTGRVLLKGTLIECDKPRDLHSD